MNIFLFISTVTEAERERERKKRLTDDTQLTLCAATIEIGRAADVTALIHAHLSSCHVVHRVSIAVQQNELGIMIPLPLRRSRAQGIACASQFSTGSGIDIRLR